MHELKNGYMCFDKLWSLLNKKGMNKQRLKENGLHSNTVAKLAKNENVTTDVLCKLCSILKCQPHQIMEYKGVTEPVQEVSSTDIQDTDKQNLPDWMK